MSAPTLPTDSNERKRIPLASGVLDYFPAALAEVARISWVGNEKHNPGEPLHWSRSKSGDHADTLARHFLERGTVDEILRAPRHPYTQALLEAAPSPRLDAVPSSRRLRGEMPSAATPPAGCAFHPRCPWAEAICRSHAPEAATRTATHTVHCHFALSGPWA